MGQFANRMWPRFASSRSLRRAVALLIVTACLAVACGDGGADGDEARRGAGSTSGSPESLPAGLGPPIRIGVLVNKTGQTPGERNAAPVLEAWSRAVNGQGGLRGHAVEFVIEDSRGDPAAAASAVERLVSDEGIIALALFDSGAEPAVLDAIARSGVPVIGGERYMPGGNPGWYSVITGFPSYLNLLWVAASEAGATNTVFVVCAENPVCATSEPVARAASDRLGLGFAGIVRVAFSAPDYTAECLSIVSDHVDAVMIGTETSAILRLARDCATQGFDGRILMFGGTVNPEVMVENDPGVPLDYTLFSFPWYVDDAPVAAYREMMEAQGVDESTWASPHATAAYATAELLRAAADQTTGAPTDPMTRADLVEAYAALDGEQLDGLLPAPVRFGPDGQQQPVPCAWVGTFADGEFTGGGLDEVVCDTP